MSADESEWVCHPCSETIPGRVGRLTVHGETDPDRLTVWCPWCGDQMERAGREADQSGDVDSAE